MVIEQLTINKYKVDIAYYNGIDFYEALKHTYIIKESLNVDK